MKASRPLAAIGLMVLANGLTAGVDAIVKQLSVDLHAVQILWGYFLIITLTLLGYRLARRETLRGLLRTAHPVLQLTRAGLLALTLATLFIAIAHLPLADAIALSFMAPLFVTVLAVPMLGEPFRAYRLVAVLVGFAGVLVILRPGFVALDWAVTMPIVSALFWALFQLTTRRLAETEATATTLLYTSAGGVLWASLAVAPFWRPVGPDGLQLLVAAGLLGAAAHFCVIRSFELAEASLLAPFNYVKLVWVAALGYFLFDERLQPFTLIGSVVIIGSGVYVLLRSRSPATPA